MQKIYFYHILNKKYANKHIIKPKNRRQAAVKITCKTESFIPLQILRGIFILRQYDRSLLPK